jgi:hypothetical protein
MKLRLIVPLVLTALLAHAGLAGEPSPETITLASTTSVDNSGLLAAIPADLHQGERLNGTRPGAGYRAGTRDSGARRSRSNSSSTRFESKGESGPPCGVPSLLFLE